MKQSGHLNPSEETGTGCPVTSKYGRTPSNKHGVECAFISPVRTECGMFLMYCMQCCMSVSAVL